MARRREEIQEAILVWYGEKKMAELGIDGGQMPEKPDLLILFGQTQQGLLLDGGVLDQPYQMMTELSWTAEIVQLQEKPNGVQGAKG